MSIYVLKHDGKTEFFKAATFRYENGVITIFRNDKQPIKNMILKPNDVFEPLSKDQLSEFRVYRWTDEKYRSSQSHLKRKRKKKDHDASEV